MVNEERETLGVLMTLGVLNPHPNPLPVEGRGRRGAVFRQTFYRSSEAFGVEWLAGIWCGRCGLVARVPQDRMPS